MLDLEFRVDRSEEEIVVVWMTQVLGNGIQNEDSKYSNKGVPMRSMLQSIVYSSVVDGKMKKKYTKIVEEKSRLMVVHTYITYYSNVHTYMYI